MDSRRQTNKLVLLVEDDSDIREIFTVFLEEAGFTVVQATDGAQAWRLIGKYAARCGFDRSLYA